MRTPQGLATAVKDAVRVGRDRCIRTPYKGV
jgi:hypothetical protein